MAGVSMKDIKLRIRSMESTRQITKAMEMVAASKLRRAQDRALRSRPYFELFYQTIMEVCMSSRAFASPYIGEPGGKAVCMIVIAGDRGLAGGYNHNVIKLAEEKIKGRNAVILPIGKKALEHFRARGSEILTDVCAEAASMSISDCFTLARTICREYLDGRFDEVQLAYTSFASILVQTPCTMQMLPLPLPPQHHKEQQITLYEPNGEVVLNTIIPEYLGGLIYGALSDSIASEQGARRTAMESATKNADEMIGDLNLKYNRARQGAITQEITEIVAGADA